MTTASLTHRKMNNPVVNAMLCALQCCMWALEKCLKFISMHAYIQVFAGSVAPGSRL